jgi:hypothetical protein
MESAIIADFQDAIGKITIFDNFVFFLSHYREKPSNWIALALGAVRWQEGKAQGASQGNRACIAALARNS